MGALAIRWGTESICEGVYNTWLFAIETELLLDEEMHGNGAEEYLGAFDDEGSD